MKKKGSSVFVLVVLVVLVAFGGRDVHASTPSGKPEGVTDWSAAFALGTPVTAYHGCPNCGSRRCHEYRTCWFKNEGGKGGLFGGPCELPGYNQECDLCGSGIYYLVLPEGSPPVTLKDRYPEIFRNSDKVSIYQAKTQGGNPYVSHGAGKRAYAGSRFPVGTKVVTNVYNCIGGGTTTSTIIISW